MTNQASGNEASALDRITQDLNVEEQARTWLHHAKDHVSRRAQVKGLKGGRRAPRGDDTSGAQAPRPKIRPTLDLRPATRQPMALGGGGAEFHTFGEALLGSPTHTATCYGAPGKS